MPARPDGSSREPTLTPICAKTVRLAGRASMTTGIPLSHAKTSSEGEAGSAACVSAGIQTIRQKSSARREGPKTRDGPTHPTSRFTAEEAGTGREDIMCILPFFPRVAKPVRLPALPKPARGSMRSMILMMTLLLSGGAPAWAASPAVSPAPALPAATPAPRPAPAQQVDWNAVSSEAIALLRQYVQLESVNPPADTRQTAAFLQAILQKEGIETRTFESAPGKVNLLARLPATVRPAGATRPGAVMLLHHMD